MIKNVIIAHAAVVSKSVVGDLNPSNGLKFEHAKNKNKLPMYGIIYGILFTVFLPITSVTILARPPTANSKNI